MARRTMVGPNDTFIIGTLGEIRLTAPSDTRQLTRSACRGRYRPRSHHGRGDPAAPDLDLRPGRRQHHPHRLQPAGLRIQGLRGRHRRRRRPPALAMHRRHAAVRRRRAGAAIRDGLAIYGKDNLHEGDIVITNDAGTIGQHLNNVVMYTPVFAPDTRALIALLRRGRALARRRRARHRLAVEICDRHLPGRHPVPHRQAALARRAGARKSTG